MLFVNATIGFSGNLFLVAKALDVSHEIPRGALFVPPQKHVPCWTLGSTMIRPVCDLQSRFIHGVLRVYIETNWCYRLVYLPLSAVITPLKGVNTTAIHPSPNVDYGVD